MAVLEADSQDRAVLKIKEKKKILRFQAVKYNKSLKVLEVFPLSNMSSAVVKLKAAKEKTESLTCTVDDSDNGELIHEYIYDGSQFSDGAGDYEAELQIVLNDGTELQGDELKVLPHYLYVRDNLG